MIHLDIKNRAEGLGKVKYKHEADYLTGTISVSVYQKKTNRPFKQQNG